VGIPTAQLVQIDSLVEFARHTRRMELTRYGLWPEFTDQGGATRQAPPGSRDNLGPTCETHVGYLLRFVGGGRGTLRLRELRRNDETAITAAVANGSWAYLPPSRIESRFDVSANADGSLQCQFIGAHLSPLR